MKLLLTALTLFSFFGSSFAFQLEEEEEEEDSIVLAEPVFIDYDWNQQYYPVPAGIIFTPTGPSANEISLTAKLDSNEVQLNLLADQIDSMNRVQIKQSSSIRSLKRLDLQNKNRITKAHKVRKDQAEKSTEITSILAVTAVIGTLFALRLFLSRPKKKQVN